MRVLDIDLDFFLNYVAHERNDELERLSSDYIPWREQDVRRFLEYNCGLVPSVPGRVVRSHHEAFFFWKELISSGQLKTPFELVHIDAHLDTGGWGHKEGGLFILNKLVHFPVKQRPNNINFMDAGNYLAFAVACHWLSSVTFVLHPEGTSEISFMIAKDFDSESGFFQISKFEKEINVQSIRETKRCTIDIEVPFKVLGHEDFNNKQAFDFIVLSISPGFTPKESDALIPVIEKFITPI